MSKTASGIGRILTVAAILTVPIIAAAGQNTPVEIPGLYNTEKLDWRQVDSYMSAREYREASRHNRQLFRKAAHRAIEDTLMSYGIPRQGVALTGAAVGLAVKQGAKVNLNETKTLTMEVKDVVSGDRAVSFHLKLDW